MTGMKTTMASSDPIAATDNLLEQDAIEAAGHSFDEEDNIFEATSAATSALTAQSLPYAFAKRHGVLLGQISDDEVDVIYHGQ